MIRRAVVLGATIAGVGAATAFASSIPSGTYHGHWGTSKSANLSFSVSGGAVHNFKTSIAAMCLSSTSPFGYGSTFETQTFVVPVAKITHGKVKTTYKIRSHGQVIGQRTITATFQGGKATGTLSGSSTGCTIAKYSWSAHR
jgi:hypothetical protein